MKYLIPVIILLVLASLGYNYSRDKIVSAQKERVADTIRIGDDIHEAKSKLIDLGFHIDYGPDFPGKKEKYLMMIVDYGVSPSAIDTLKYTVGMSVGSGEPIDGIIKATPGGVITSIE
jgi:hypothetical protein